MIDAKHSSVIFGTRLVPIYQITSGNTQRGSLLFQIEHLDTVPQAVLDHVAEHRQVRAQAKAKRSDKYVLDEAFANFTSSASHNTSSLRPLSTPWVLYYASCCRRHRHHHHEKHSLAGKHGKTHGVSIFPSLRFESPGLIPTVVPGVLTNIIITVMTQRLGKILYSMYGKK